jgi:hypothetical protein
VAILCLISAVWGCRSIIEVIHCHDICCDIFGLCVNFFLFLFICICIGFVYMHYTWGRLYHHNLPGLPWEKGTSKIAQSLIYHTSRSRSSI